MRRVDKSIIMRQLQRKLRVLKIVMFQIKTAEEAIERDFSKQINQIFKDIKKQFKILSFLFSLLH